MMKPIRLQFLILLGLFAMTLLTPAYAKTISVRVTNIDTTRPGNILAMLFNDDGFPKDHSKAIERQNRKADAEELMFSFVVTSEQFAIKILHDENQDGKTSKNWTGIIPSEGLGFSNGAKLTLLGPPKFKKAALNLNETTDTLEIQLIYP